MGTVTVCDIAIAISYYFAKLRSYNSILISDFNTPFLF